MIGGRKGEVWKVLGQAQLSLCASSGMVCANSARGVNVKRVVEILAVMSVSSFCADSSWPYWSQPILASFTIFQVEGVLVFPQAFFFLICHPVSSRISI